MRALKKVQIEPAIIIRSIAFLSAIWGLAFGKVLHSDSKEFAYLPAFWTLDLFICPIICAVLAGLLVYGAYQRNRPRNSLTGLAIFTGLTPLLITVYISLFH